MKWQYPQKLLFAFFTTLWLCLVSEFQRAENCCFEYPPAPASQRNDEHVAVMLIFFLELFPLLVFESDSTSLCHSMGSSAYGAPGALFQHTSPLPRPELTPYTSSAYPL